MALFESKEEFLAAIQGVVQKEVERMSVRVGKPAPEFVTKGYIQGEIKTVKLADYRGKWVMLYFYPGDFTFV